jgi:hypothetical protein
MGLKGFIMQVWLHWGFVHGIQKSEHIEQSQMGRKLITGSGSKLPSHYYLMVSLIPRAKK